MAEYRLAVLFVFVAEKRSVMVCFVIVFLC